MRAVTGITLSTPATAGSTHYPLELGRSARVHYRGGMNPSPGTRLLQVAVALFAVGLLALLALFATPVLTDHTAPTAVYLLTACAPLGFLLGIVYALRSGRRVSPGQGTSSPAAANHTTTDEPR